jgi:hypothetical protein
MNRKDFDKMIQRIKRKGGHARCLRSQLPELAAKGITKNMIRALGVEIVDDLDDQNNYLVCLSAARLICPDNVYGVCAMCGGAIQHRPDVAAKLIRICLQCAERKTYL